MEKQTIWMELVAGSKLAKKPKHQGVKWLFLKVWGKTVKVTKPQGAKRKFTQKKNCFVLMPDTFSKLKER
ncbi:hypothetical protein HanXRQr2_Chr05g0234621 [Helianthus annuus]|uniref:Uncharacterized protein n=1 Tax=Helianthus annuus TaxID=4232 RepID=A0A9K3J256_HELAN|nr:hypothetical protein HanXRQr2_Chr05g0234621 [Helianthus annuus]